MSQSLPIELLMNASEKLGDLCSEVVFLGGSVVGLLVTEAGTMPPRFTNDVDIAILVSSQMEYYDVDRRLLARGFVNDIDGPVCRYLHRLARIDVIPVNASSLEAVNNWYPLAIETADSHVLPNNISIKLISPVCFLGTKLVAFNAVDREGRTDIFMSRDFGDIITVIDGRPEIIQEVLTADSELRKYLQDQFSLLLEENYFEEAIAEHVDSTRENVVIDRIREFLHTR